MREIIHQLKYGNNIALALPLGGALVQLYRSAPYPADLVTVVPMSRQRRLRRGYNQASLIARAFCRAAGLPFSSSVLRRIRQTESQVGKHPRERMLNVKDAFAAETEFVAGKTVLVIDDVFTTGATMRSCANALKQAGAGHVIGLTAARAGLHQEEPLPAAAARAY
jgi:ComF family protein